MKKLLIFIIILAVLALFMKVTVPQPEKHRQEASKRLTQLVGDKLSTIQGWQDMAEGQDFDVQALINVALDQIKVKDYFVCNVGSVTYDGKTYPLTIGVFNHVFVLTDYFSAIQKAGEKVDEYRDKF